MSHPLEHPTKHPRGGSVVDSVADARRRASQPQPQDRARFEEPEHAAKAEVPGRCVSVQNARAPTSIREPSWARSEHGPHSRMMLGGADVHLERRQDADDVALHAAREPGRNRDFVRQREERREASAEVASR